MKRLVSLGCCRFGFVGPFGALAVLPQSVHSQANHVLELALPRRSPKRQKSTGTNKTLFQCRLEAFAGAVSHSSTPATLKTITQEWRCEASSPEWLPQAVRGRGKIDPIMAVALTLALDEEETSFCGHPLL